MLYFFLRKRCGTVLSVIISSGNAYSKINPFTIKFRFEVLFFKLVERVYQDKFKGYGIEFMYGRRKCCGSGSGGSVI
jgi:hypothetical protein